MALKDGYGASGAAVLPYVGGTAAWRGREKLAAVIEDEVLETRSSDAAYVAGKVARMLMREEPALGYLIGLDEIAQRVQVHVVDVARTLGREMDAGGQPPGAAERAAGTPEPSASNQKEGGGHGPGTAHDAASHDPPSPSPETTTAGRGRDTAPGATVAALPSRGHPKPAAGRTMHAAPDAADKADPAGGRQKVDGGHKENTARDVAAPPTPPSAAKRKPAPAKYDAAALGKAMAKADVAKGLLDTFTIAGGRVLGDVPWGELETLAKRSRFEADLLGRLRRCGKTVSEGVKVREAVNEATLKRLIAEARKATAR